MKLESLFLPLFLEKGLEGNSKALASICVFVLNLKVYHNYVYFYLSNDIFLLIKEIIICVDVMFCLVEQIQHSISRNNCMSKYTDRI